MPYGRSSRTRYSTFASVYLLVAGYGSDNPEPDEQPPRPVTVFSLRETDPERTVRLTGSIVPWREADPGSWSRCGLTLEQLQDLVREGESGAGRYGSREAELVRRLQQIRVSRGDRSPPARLEDLGVRVRRGFLDPPSSLTRFGDGSGSAPCALLALFAREEADIARGVETRLKRARISALPSGVDVSVVSDRGRTSRHAVAVTRTRLLEGYGLILAVLFLLMGIRVALVITLALPAVAAGLLVLPALFAIFGETKSGRTPLGGAPFGTTPSDPIVCRVEETETVED